jgi:hypothetical protein
VRAFTLSFGRRRAAQDGELPLHCAAVGDASEAVVAALLKAYPEAAKEANKACGRTAPASLTLTFLASAPLRALRVAAHRRRCSHHERYSLACSRLHAAPHRYLHRAQSGKLPLHCATIHQASEAVLRMLLDAHPEAAVALDEAAKAASIPSKRAQDVPRVSGN